MSSVMSSTANQNFMKFHTAIEKGNLEEFKQMLPLVNPSMWDNLAVKSAGLHNKVEMLQILLEDSRVDPTADENDTIKTAIQIGHVEIVKLLIGHPKVHSTLNYEEAIWCATFRNQQAVLKILKEAQKN